MFKVNNRNTRTRCELTKLTIKTYFTPCSSVTIVNFEQVNADWDEAHFLIKKRFLINKPYIPY